MNVLIILQHKFHPIFSLLNLLGFYSKESKFVEM